MRRFKRFFWNIKNICGWIPVLWNNWHWSSSYLLDIMEHKMKLMQKFFEKDAIINEEVCKQIAKELEICADACKHLSSEDYELELIDAHYEKYPFLDNWLEHINDPMSEEERKDWEEMHTKITSTRHEYEAKLFDTLKEKSWEWVD